jgi:hypothetical protein
MLRIKWDPRAALGNISPADFRALLTLLQAFDLMEVYEGDDASKLLYYSSRKGREVFFDLPLTYQGRTITVALVRCGEPDPQRPLSRVPVERLAHTTFAIPLLARKGDVEDCSVCLQPFEQRDLETAENLYVTSCGHMFHSNCLWTYLRANNFARKTAESCSQYGCFHPEKVAVFPCPVCKSQVQP